MDGDRKPRASPVPRAAEPGGPATATIEDPDRLDRDELAALKAIVEGTACNTGEEFFQSLVRHLSRAIDVHYAFVAEFAAVKTRRAHPGLLVPRHIHPNIEYDLAETPCEDVVEGSLCHYPTGVKEQFTRDRPLVEMGIESYLGVPLLDAAGNHLGHLAVFDERPMPPEPRRLYTFRIFAARAAAELERLRFEQRLAESERRYRDLYEEAPIGYHSTRCRWPGAHRQPPADRVARLLRRRSWWASSAGLHRRFPRRQAAGTRMLSKVPCRGGNPRDGSLSCAARTAAPCGSACGSSRFAGPTTRCKSADPSG